MKLFKMFVFAKANHKSILICIPKPVFKYPVFKYMKYQGAELIEERLLTMKIGFPV